MHIFTFRILFVFSLFIWTVSTTSSVAQNCDAKLSVYQDRDARSVTKGNPTQFQLILTNNSSSSQTYSLTYKDQGVDCELESKQTKSDNNGHNYLVDFLVNAKKVNVLTIPAYGNVTFYAKVSATEDVKIETWTCVEILAKAQNCSKGTVKILKVFSPDPSNN